MQFFRRLADPGGAQDEPHVLGDLETGHSFAGLVAIIAFNLARHPAGARIIGHRDQVAPGQADECRQRRAFIAALFLLNLDQQLLTFGQHVFDIDAATVTGALALVLEVGPGDFL